MKFIQDDTKHKTDKLIIEDQHKRNKVDKENRNKTVVENI